MAKKSLIVKSQKKPKFSVRMYMRCLECGRSRAVHHEFLLCRIHLRTYIVKGLLPGFKKASW